MKGLIIAAGEGRRLKNLTRDNPKPLIKLLGLSLIERVILTAKKAGVDEFLVVTGYLGNKIKDRLDDGSSYGVKIEYIENSDWRKGNGTSVLKAKEILNEDFVLLMSDHIFDERIVRGLLSFKNKFSVVLAVDRREALDEDTKVLEEEGRIVDIGKKIEKYNSIDTGIFLCSPRFFSYIEEEIKEGRAELSDGVRRASNNKDAAIFDISKIGEKDLWIDIDTEEDLKAAQKMITSKLIKKTDGPISRYFNRKISIILSKQLVKTGIKPNLVSFFSFLLSVLSGLFFLKGTYLNVFIGGLIAQISSIVDGCDGEIARMKFQESDYGGWFDTVLDRYADAFIIFGMTYGLYRFNHEISVWIAGFFTLLGCFMNTYTAERYDTMLKKGKNRIKIRIGRDIRLFLIMLGAFFNQIFYTLIILGIITNFESIRRLFVLREQNNL